MSDLNIKVIISEFNKHFAGQEAVILGFVANSNLNRKIGFLETRAIVKIKGKKQLYEFELRDLEIQDEN